MTDPRQATVPAWQAWLVPIVLGCLHALTFAPYPLPLWALPFVQIFVLAAWLVRLTHVQTRRHALREGFLFGLGNFTLGLYWLFISMHVYGGLAWPLAAAGVFVLAAFLALFPLLAALLAYYAGTRPINQPLRWWHQVLLAAGWASAWTLTEWLRGTLLTGFPWLNAGYAHAEGVLAPWAPLVGAYGLAWLASYAAAAIALLTRHKDTSQAGGAAVAVALAIMSGLGGIVLSHQEWTQPTGDPMIARLIQGAVPQSIKFDPDHMMQGVQRYQELASLEPKTPESRPDLIVLPETVIPVFQDLLSSEAWQEWIDIARHHDAPILMGAPLRDPEAQRYTNSAIVISPDTSSDALRSAQIEQRYDKHHLVPFGEFVPPGFRWFVDALNIPLGDFSRGQVRQPAFQIQNQRVAPDICYEDVFGEEILQQVRDSDAHGPGASILINISNLAWFGDTWALRQHLQIARIRALETSRPMLRATNTGMTAAIDADGTVRAMLDPAEPGVLDVEVQGQQGLTPYAQWGNPPVLAWSVLWWLWAASFVFRRRKH